MLKEVACDAVYIATPVFCHYEQAMLALKYDRNVLIEKPIARTEAESAEILDAFKKAGKQLSVGYMMKYHSLHQKARSFIKKDKVGKVNNVRLQFSCWYPDIPGAWRQTKALSGGGAIMDLAVHCMELFTAVTGDTIDKYKAFFATRSFQYEVEDSAVITFKSEGGILGHIDVNFNIPDNAAASRLEIYGTDGSIFAEGTLSQEEVGQMKYIYSPQGAYEAQQNRVVDEAQIFEGAGQNIYLKNFNNFARIIQSGKPDYTSADRALKIQMICDDIYENNCY
jgi:predicted dehydrogenase